MRAARPEVEAASPADLLEKAEMARRVLDCVIALDEPYRSTVILRFYDGKSPAEIAGLQGVPAATVRTRIGRALARLRLRLDRAHGGERAAWRAALLPIAGIEMPPLVPTATGAPAGGAAGSGSLAASAAGSSSVSAGTAAGGAAFAIGGIIMTQKSMIFAGLACALTLAVGFGVGRNSGSRPYEKRLRDGDLVAREDLALAETERDEARKKLSAAEKALAKAAAEGRDLQAKLESMKKDLEGRKEAAAAAEKAAKKKAPIAFGKYGDLEGLREADWKEIGAAVLKMNDLMVEISKRIGEGLPPVTPEIQEKIRDENNKLVKLAASIMGKIPTSSPLNGEYSHPACLSNIMAAMLAQAELPLTEEQKAELSKLGGEFDSTFEEIREVYGEETPLFRKYVDELELKARFMEEVEGALTKEQREAIIRPEIHDLMQIDVLSPMTMATLIAEPTYADSPEKHRSRYSSKIAESFKLNEDQKAALGPALDAYFAEVEPLFKDRVDPKLNRISLGEALTAARAHLKVLETVLKLQGLDEGGRAQAMGGASWSVPLLTKKE